jgi:hypothetical protein
MVTRKNTGVKMVTVTLKLPPDWVALIDNWVRDQPDVLMNRSDAIRLAIQEKFVAERTKTTTHKAPPKRKD